MHPAGRAIRPANDATFTTRAAAAGMAEVELGRLAEQKAENAAVKAFAKKLVIDHTVSNAELKKLADQEKIALPTAQVRGLVRSFQGMRLFESLTAVENVEVAFLDQPGERLGGSLWWPGWSRRERATRFWRAR